MEKKSESGRSSLGTSFWKRSLSDSRIIPAAPRQTQQEQAPQESGNMRDGEDLDIPTFLRKKK